MNEKESATGIDEYLEMCRYEQPILEIIADEYEKNVDGPSTSIFVVVDKDTFQQCQKELNILYNRLPKQVNDDPDDATEQIDYRHISIRYNMNYGQGTISIRDGFDEQDRIRLL